MKKTILVALLCVSASVLNSCGSDDPGINCISLTNDVTNTLSESIDNPSTETCNAYKTALQNFLNNNCSPDAETEASFRQQLESIGDCTVL